MKRTNSKFYRYYLLLITSILTSFCAIAQSETIPSGSFIINMGNTNTASINDDVKPYGMIYDLMKNYNVPVKWVIANGKVKDGADFTHNGIVYKAGTFIIPAGFRTTAVEARISYWQTQGVVGATSVSDFTANVYKTLVAVPRWTLDAANGGIAQGYLTAAGITLTAFPNAYNWKGPQTLDCCDDFFVMPHADPTWATHSKLFSWNKDCLGSIWAACHAVSALENTINTTNPAEQMNFLSTRTGYQPTGITWPNNSLKLWGQHSGGTVPYTHTNFDDPVAQYMGVTDLSQLNGSEQIYIPKQTGDAAPSGGPTRWRPGAKIIAYDPSQVNVPNPDYANGNVAAVMVYGRGMDDPTRGFVMYEAGHSHMKGTTSDGPALRAFLNFSFFQVQPKAPQLTVTGISGGLIMAGNTTITGLNVSATSPLVGITFSYEWISSCGGTFSNPNGTTTNFTAPSVGVLTQCLITCKVTDNCGRSSYQSFPVTITPPPVPPVAVNDNASLPACAPGTSITVNVLSNDSDPQGSPFTLTSLGTASPVNAGTWSIQPDSSITFLPNPNFSGAASIPYTITNGLGGTAIGTLTVTVGTVDANGCSQNQVYTTSEAALITLATGSFISQNGTTANADETSLDDIEGIYSDNNVDFVNLGTNATNNYLIHAIGSTAPLRAKDTINVYWSKANNNDASMSVQIGISGTGPWTNLQTFSITGTGSGTSRATVSKYIVPTGVSGITHVRLSPGIASPAANSSSGVSIDAIEYLYLNCVSKIPGLLNDAATVLEDVPSVINVLNNDTDPQGLGLTLKQIVTQPTSGKVSINTNGTITYVSNTDFSGTDLFTYEACNSQGFCGTATVNITIVDDGCAAGSYRANPPGGAVTKVFQYQLTGTNAATANSTTTNFYDTYLRQANPTNNYATTNPLLVGGLNNVSNTKGLRPVYFFNISEIPTNAVVQNATFSVYRSGGNNNAQLIKIHGLSNNFVENQATWNIRSTGNNWISGGGDFGLAQDSLTIAGVIARYNWNIATLAQGWVANAANNYGVILKTNEGLNKSHQLRSKDAGAISERPALSITYVVPQPCAVITNRAPFANPDYITAVNGGSVVINPLTNDTDVDAGNTFTVTQVFGLTGGSATFTTNSITYTAGIGALRTERLSYEITDNNGAKDTAYAYITINNSAPVASRDISSANSGVMQSVPVKTNDSDPEGGSLTAPEITLKPKNGTAVIAGNNIEYTPVAGFTGNDTLIYRICETVAGSCSPAPFCDTALVVFTVVNQAPVAVNNLRTILPCITTTFSLISNDTDPENGLLQVTNVSALSNPAAGTLTNNNDGTVTFLPATGFSGNVTFTYTVTDNGVTPLVSAPATVTITVFGPVNTTPDAVNDTDILNMDETNFASVRDNDTDPDGDELRIPTITVAPLHGTAIVLANGLIAYTPNPGYYGTDVLTYQLCDSSRIPATCAVAPPLCDVATLSYTIIAPNTVIAINDENSTWINTPVSGAVLGNDFDPQGDDPLIFNGYNIGGTLYTTGTQTVSGFDQNGTPVANAGSLTINPDGTYTFTPALNFTGVVDVPYFIQDSNPNTAEDDAKLRISVNPLPGIANSVIANNDENRVFGGATVSSTLFANDSDPQANSFTVTGYMYDTNGDGTADGTGTLNSAVTVGGVTTSGLPVSNAGSLTINTNGSYTFTPAPDFSGSIDVPYTICDNIIPPACATAILHIDVLVDANGPANNPPQPGDDFAYTKINTPVTSNFIRNDSDPNNDPLSLNGTTINTGGPATPIGVPVTTAKGGTVQYFANGTYTYTPPAGYVGPDSVEYEICDVTAIAPQPLCNKAFLHLLVGVNNSTDAINDETSTWQDVNVSGGILANDFDAENNTQTFGSFLAQGAIPGAAISTGATLSGVNKSGAPVVNAGLLTFDANGNYTFDPDPSFTGTVSVPYRVCDNGNQNKCDTAYLTITIDPLPTTGINTVIANNDENISYGAPVGGSLFVNDRDPQNDAFTVTSFVGGIVATPGPIGGIDLNGNPVANAGTLTINANGTYTFTPAAGFVGSVNVPYTITDANGATSRAILHIDVLKDPNGPVNDPPVAGDDFGYTTINKPVTGSFISNDSDPNADPVSYMGVTINPAGPATAIGIPVATAQGGTVQFYANGTYLYTPPSGYVGPDRLPYSICDVTAVLPQPLCSDATLHLLVGPGINIAGSVWNDGNGNVNINGGENGTNAGNSLYVNLIDGLGNVVATTPVATDGTYSFINVNPGADYSLQLSTNQGTVGNTAPVVSLPSGWSNTGENRNGTIDGGTASIIDTRNFGFTNTINFDFGIERLPNSDNHTTTIPQPVIGTVVVLNGGSNPPVLSGIDPEDCNGGCTLSNKSVVIDAVPSNSDLYYNGVLVTNGQQINNFNPNLLEIRMTAVSILTLTTSFQYSYVDLAGKKDPSPATFRLNWSIPLPITLASFKGIANKCDAVLQWKTSAEINADKFVIEQSSDGLNFTETAVVKSANNSIGKSYQMSVSQPNSIKYYRLKMLDKDGKFSYSPIITVRTNCSSKDYMTVYPNPVSTNLTVSFQTAYKGQATLQILNAVGQQLAGIKIYISTQANTINLDMTNYASGLYFLSLLNDNGDKIGEVQKIFKK